MSQPANNPNRVLQDHVKKGKVLVPPFVAILGPSNDVSWHYEILPEVIWIALLHKMHGENEGTRLALALAQALVNKGTIAPVGFDSEIASLDLNIQEKARNELLEQNILEHILSATAPLIRYAPTTGLRFLAKNLAGPCTTLDHDTIKAIVEELFDKESRFTVMVQATVVYIAFVLDRLKVCEGLSLARFPEIEAYPETEISMRIASSIRESLLMFFGSRDQNNKIDWARNFWNYGIQNSVCLT